jgi:hypothetical protein
MKKKILFIIGSTNQTSQMYQISQLFCDEYDCYFSQVFTDLKLAKFLRKYGVFDTTVYAGQFKKNSDKFLREHNLREDYEARLNHYDLVFHCTDVVIPTRLRKTKNVHVQEGMIDKYTWVSKLVQTINLPSWVTIDTSLNGASNVCDLYCSASEGYKNHTSKLGTAREKIFVTGIPNFDDIAQFKDNDFPHKNYVMVATSDLRETARLDNRIDFIKEAVRIAAGRPMLFKLHPNEKYDRAYTEIRNNAPADSLIFLNGNSNHMVANCDELVTQYSTLSYVGLILGKKVNSYFDIDLLKRLIPVQNGGTSAQNIAKIGRDFIEFKGRKEDFARQYLFEPIAAKTSDIGHWTLENKI